MSTETIETPRKLPPRIKPRALKRRKDSLGFTYYRTSDGRYEITPMYAHRPRGGLTITIEQWRVEDLKNPKAENRFYGDLDTVRHLLCTRTREMPWVVGDMDQGILHVAASRKAARDWAEDFACAPLASRSHFEGSTCWDYRFNHPGEDGGTDVYIMRADHAHLHGFDAEQEPFYPYPDDPHEEGPRGRAWNEEN
ncbi:hypothetical protein [Kitasatospora viridis]|uniref:Uncharacterized protein n=1 Tax=Kitasatospora viridis TaxID=281105 RepID=A0A561SA31_9ACTN|nr:hypothetical protein [Kitasatospora viridis]TWF71730.1 hypothetical protein FHX73_18101 [Kitasatospora viridis]